MKLLIKIEVAVLLALGILYAGDAVYYHVVRDWF